MWTWFLLHLQASQVLDVFAIFFSFIIFLPPRHIVLPYAASWLDKLIPQHCLQCKPSLSLSIVSAYHLLKAWKAVLSYMGSWYVDLSMHFSISESRTPLTGWSGAFWYHQGLARITLIIVLPTRITREYSITNLAFTLSICFYVGEIIPISFVANKQSHSSVLQSLFPGIFSIGLEKEERKTLVSLCDLNEDP